MRALIAAAATDGRRIMRPQLSTAATPHTSKHWPTGPGPSADVIISAESFQINNSPNQSETWRYDNSKA